MPGWQNDLMSIEVKVGDGLMAQANLVEALASYLDGLAIISTLTRVGPGNIYAAAASIKSLAAASCRCRIRSGTGGCE
jgi:hypothetical protein